MNVSALVEDNSSLCQPPVIQVCPPATMLLSTSILVVQHEPVLLSTNEADSPPLLLPRFGLRHSISVEDWMLMFAGGPVYTHSACALDALPQQNEFVMVGVVL